MIVPTKEITHIQRIVLRSFKFLNPSIIELKLKFSTIYFSM